MLFGIVFSSITFISFTETLTKREAANLKFSTPAIITSNEVIIARYDAIIDHSERAHSYNHRSNYANYRYWLTTSIQAAVITFYTMMMGEMGGEFALTIRELSCGKENYNSRGLCSKSFNNMFTMFLSKRMTFPYLTTIAPLLNIVLYVFSISRSWRKGRE